MCIAADGVTKNVMILYHTTPSALENDLASHQFFCSKKLHEVLWLAVVLLWSCYVFMVFDVKCFVR